MTAPWKAAEVARKVKKSFEEDDIGERLEFLKLGEEDLSRIRENAEHLRAISTKLVERFYAHLAKFPELASLLAGRIDRLKETQKIYFEEMLSGKIDLAYVERRALVGRTHERVNLAPKWYVGAFLLYIELTSTLLREERAFQGDVAKAWEVARSLTKLVFFDVGITIDVYIGTLMETVRSQESALRELSTPVIEVWDETLVLPLIGTMDTRRAQEVTESLLNAVVAHRARVVILDITGLPLIDTSTANHIFRAVRAVELLGAIPIVTGIRPAIAQTVVSLGIDASILRTRARLVDGLRWAFELTGHKVVKVAAPQLEKRPQAPAVAHGTTANGNGHG